MRLFW